MPLGDGTGPRGEGPGTGRGLGKCRGGTGQDKGYSRGIGFGQNTEKNMSTGIETGTRCVCPDCGRKVTPLKGVSCSEIRCLNCGTIMVKEEK